MPQPGGGGGGSAGGQPYLPYPTTSAGTSFPSPYPNSNFGGYPTPYMGSANTNPAHGYPPYMNNPSASGYNNFYGGVSKMDDVGGEKKELI